MRWSMLVATVALAAAGCRHNCDLVEAELRSSENEVRHLREELNRLEGYNDSLEREVVALRTPAPAKVTPEQATQAYTLREVRLGRLTGGVGNPGCTGDEALQVVVEPRDSDGHIIKTPGALYVEAQEITPQGVKTPLSTWEVTPDQLRRTWRDGFLLTGYVLDLPWKVWPSQPKLRVTARFVLSDERVYEAERDITVRVMPAGQRPPTAAEPAPAPPPGEPAPLPAPRLAPVPPSLDAVGQQPMTANEALRAAVLWQPRPLGSAVQLERPTPGQDWRR